MKSVVAVLLSVLLCVQPVYAMPVNEADLCGDLQEKTGSLKDRDTGGQDHLYGKADFVVQNSAKVKKDPKEQKNIDEEEEDNPEDAAPQEEAGGQEAGSGAEGMTVSAPSAILMEASTGQVIFEKDADTQRPPASVTKVMTLLLIFDALSAGKISLDDTVTTSEYAASMGGSQVFLEPGEVQTVDTMIKCISVASANDACAAFKYSRQCNSKQ